MLYDVLPNKNVIQSTSTFRILFEGNRKQGFFLQFLNKNIKFLLLFFVIFFIFIVSS